MLVEVVKAAALVVVLDVLVLEEDVVVTGVLVRVRLDAVRLVRHLVRVVVVAADLVQLLALDVMDVVEDVTDVVVLALIRVRQHVLLLASILVLGHVMVL